MPQESIEETIRRVQGGQPPPPALPAELAGRLFGEAPPPPETEFERLLSGLRAVTMPVKAGVSGLFRGLRAPQQAVTMGPVLAVTRAAERGQSPGFGEVVTASREALREDLSFRDVAREMGLEAGTATAVGLVGDLALDPLFLVTPAKLARLAQLPRLLATRPVTAALTAVRESRPGQLIGRALVTDFGKPEAYLELSERLHREVTGAVESAVDIGRRINQLPVRSQRAVRDYMEAGTPVARQTVLEDARVAGLAAEDIGRLGHEAMTRDIQLGQALVDTGLMQDQTFVKWRGKHIRREYRKYADPAHYVTDLAKRDPDAALAMEAKLKAASGWRGLGTAPLRERLDFLKRRKDLPAEIRAELGEIFEAAYPVAHGQALAGRAVAMRRFLVDVDRQFSRGTMAPGYQLAGDSKSLGPLAGKYLPEALADDVAHIVARPGAFERYWRQGVGWWKYGKVVVNPPTHARNIVSNAMLADMAGLSIFKPYRYAEALTSLVRKDHWYQEARDAGSFLLDTFAGAELPRLVNADTLPGLEGALTRVSRYVLRPAKTGLRAAARAYQGEEELFKMAFYIDRRKAGLLPRPAAQAAERALFNYRRVPRFIDALRTWGVVPFVTFPYKALPATARALAERPFTLNRYGNIFRVFEGPGAEMERQVLPDYMQDGWMRLAGTDNAGRVRYVNMSYILPFGDIGELTAGGGYFGAGGAPPGFLSSPLVGFAAAVATDRDPFRPDQRISEQPGGWTSWLRRFVAPPLLGGYAFDELRAALAQRPVNILSLTAEPRTLRQTLAANLFGLRTRPLNLEYERGQRVRQLRYDIEDIQANLRRWLRSPHVTDEEKNELLAEELGRIQDLMGQMGALAALHLPATPPPETEGFEAELARLRGSPAP